MSDYLLHKKYQISGILFVCLILSFHNINAQEPPQPAATSPPSKSNDQSDQRYKSLVEQSTELMNRGYFRAAIPALKKALELKPDSVIARYNLSMSLLNLGYSKEALAEINSALKFDPKSPLAYVGLGNVNKSMRRYSEAIEAYTRATNLDGNFITAYLSLGSLHDQLGQYAESEKAFIEAVRINPNDPTILNSLGIARFRMGRHEEGLKFIEEAVRIFPKFTRAYLNLGTLYKELGRYEESIEAYSQVIRLVPKLPHPYLNRCLDYFYLGRSEAAAQDAKAYLDYTNWNENLAQFMVIIAVLGYRQAGLQIDANILLSQAPKRLEVAAWPFPVIRYLRGEMSVQEVFDLANTSERMIEARVYLGIDLIRQGKHAEAIPYLQWARENGDRKDVEYQMALAELSRIEKSATK
jgi:Flp pilus assembly protein TadD